MARRGRGAALLILLLEAIYKKKKVTAASAALTVSMSFNCVTLPLSPAIYLSSRRKTLIAQGRRKHFH